MIEAGHINTKLQRLAALWRLPAGFVARFEELQQSCVAASDAVILSVDRTVDETIDSGEWAHSDTLQMSLPAYDFSTALIGYMIPLKENIYRVAITGTYAERVDRFVNDAPTIWLLALRDREHSSHAPEFERLMSEKYPYCGLYSQEVDTSIYAYHDSSTLTCGSNITNLPPCRVDLITGSSGS